MAPVWGHWSPMDSHAAWWASDKASATREEVRGQQWDGIRKSSLKGMMPEIHRKSRTLMHYKKIVGRRTRRVWFEALV